MTEAWLLAVESILLITTAVGVCLSAVLTADSWVRYLRVHTLLDGNYFPRMHLRMDLLLLVVQIGMGFISLIWFVHLIHGDAQVVGAIDHLWPVFPVRLSLVLFMTIVQAWNAMDRHKMHFGDEAVAEERRKESVAVDQDRRALFRRTEPE